MEWIPLHLRQQYWIGLQLGSVEDFGDPCAGPSILVDPSRLPNNAMEGFFSTVANLVAAREVYKKHY
jgi:hypothetical protein